MVVRTFPYKVTSFGLSDVGLIRDNNEDVWYEMPDTGFYILADGMGGHQSGEIAAKEAVSHMCSLVKKNIGSQLSLQGIIGTIRKAIEDTNRLVHKKSKLEQVLHGMGTTLCCMYFHSNTLVYGNVGDSRIYRLRNRKIEQLTIDHTLAKDLELIGERSPKGTSCKNIITKAIGTEPDVDPSVYECDVLLNDIYLMCSDGLSDLLSDGEIEAILNHSPTIQEAAFELVDHAKANGGHDNVTVVLTQVSIKNEKESIPRS